MSKSAFAADYGKFIGLLWFVALVVWLLIEIPLAFFVVLYAVFAFYWLFFVLGDN